MVEAAAVAFLARIAFEAMARWVWDNGTRPILSIVLVRYLMVVVAVAPVGRSSSIYVLLLQNYRWGAGDILLLLFLL